MLNEVKTRNIISGLIPRYQPLSCWHKNRVRLVPFQKFWASRTCIQQVVLSDIFWKKWRFTCLDSLQKRHKWSARKPNFKTGDIILLREKNTHRNLWPTGIVERAIESDDKMVRKAADRTIRDGKATTHIRPVTEMVLLME